MTRFFMTLDQSVDLIEYALKNNEGGKTFIPIVKSSYINSLAEIMCEIYSKDPQLTIEYTNIRPGEKLHEILISEEEMRRTKTVDNVCVIDNVFTIPNSDKFCEYSSCSSIMTKNELKEFLLSSGVLS